MNRATLRNLDASFRPYAEHLYDVCVEAGIPVVVTSGYRSWKKQADLRARWERGASPFPAALPGASRHNYGFAFDMDVPGDRDWLKPIGEYWESLHSAFVWGGRFKDPVHFEARFPALDRLVAEAKSRAVA